MAYSLGEISASVTLYDKAFKAKLKELEQNSSNSFKKIADMAAAYLSFRALTGMVKSSVTAFTIQENAVEGVRASLRNLGSEVDGNTQKFQKFASDIQSKTAFGDETVLASMSQGMRLGIRPEEIEKATTAAVGLSAKLGVDLPTAMQLVARASQGHTAALARYGLTVDENKSKEEQFQDVLRIGTESFGLAEEAAQTSGGQLAQAGNAIGDAWEAVGEELVPMLLSCAGALKGLAEAFVGADDGTQKLVVSIAALGLVMGILVKTGALAKANALATAAAHGISAVAATGSTVAHTALTVALHAATMAARALWTALGPIGAAIMVISLAIAGISYLLSRQSAELERQAKSTRAAVDEQVKLIDKNNERRAQEAQYADRLKALAKYESLNNDEMAEAEKIIEKLKNEYGDLDISLDKTTGKIKVGTKAWEDMHKAQQKQRAQEKKDLLRKQKEDLEANLKVIAHKNFEGNEEEILALSKNSRSSLIEILKDRRDELAEKGDEEGVKRINAQLEGYLKIKQQAKEIKDLESGIDQQSEARKKVANEEIRKEQTQNEEFKYKVEFDNADAGKKAQMLQKRIDEIFAKGEYQRKGQFKSAAELMAADPKSLANNKQLGERALKDQRKLLALQKDLNSLRKDSDKAFENEQKSMEKDALERTRRQADREFERQLKNLEKQGDIKGYGDLLNARLGDIEDEVLSKRQEYDNALTAAHADGIMTEAERRSLDQLSEELKTAMDDYENMQVRVSEHEEKTNAAGKTAGNFSAAVLAAQLGANEPEKETAENTRVMRRIMQENQNNENDGGTLLG